MDNEQKKKLSNRVTQRIQNEGITPTPKHFFVMRTTFLWALILIATHLNIIAISLFFYHILEFDLPLVWPLLSLKTLFFVFPYFWLIANALITMFFVRNFRSTHRGYRMRIASLIVPYIAIVGTGGYGIYTFTPLTDSIEHYFEEHFAPYPSHESHKRQIWQQPKRGLLGGAITAIDSATQFRLRSFNGQIWTIDTQSTRWRGHTKAATGQRIKCIGTVSGHHRFKAMEIRPWVGRGLRRQRCRSMRAHPQKLEACIKGNI